MTYQIERLCDVYSSAKGDHRVWKKVRGQPDGKPLEWKTEREAKSFIDLLLNPRDPDVKYRVVNLTEAEIA